MSDVQLSINGVNHYGWEEIEIRRGIEQIAGSFKLKLSNRWKKDAAARNINAGDACSVQVDGQVVITGHVDDVSTELEAKNHSIEVTGRDATGDLVDCSADAADFKDQDLTQIALTLCQPFGIPVAAATDVGAKFSKFTAELGETVFEVLEKAARYRGVLLMSDGLGGLIITRAGTTRIGTSLVEGKNIFAATGHVSWRDRFSSYKAISQLPDAESLNGTDASTAPSGTATDDKIDRHRPLIIQPAEAADAATLKIIAEHERNVRYGRSRKPTITVQGWQHAGGVWHPNYLVPLTAPTLNAKATLLISTVTLTKSASGEHTKLELVRPEAFDRVPLPEPEDEVGFG